MSDLGQTLETAAALARRRARRRLLVMPLLGQREEAETYADILRQRRPLTRWFAEHTGWQLVIDESGGFARLHKTRAHLDATRPARSARDRPPFDRRRYTLFCLALAALDTGLGQTTLRSVAETLTTKSLDLVGVRPYDASRQADRRALVEALKLLVRLGVLCERDGNAGRYASGGGGDVLYDVDDRRIAQLISAPSSPSLVADPADLPVEVYPETEEGERLRARHRVVRRLLEDPVVYYDELGEREREWLAHSLHFVHRLLEDDVGLVVERRAEGLAAIDPSRELSDERFPDGGSTVRHAALLLCEYFAERMRVHRSTYEGEDPSGRLLPGLPPSGRLVVSEAEVTEHVAALATEVGIHSGWRQAYVSEPKGASTLATEALALLGRFSLVRLVEGGIEARPAVARFATAPRDAAPGGGSKEGEQEAELPFLFDAPPPDLGEARP